jgi:multicomponent Na+:H+ antiporter subunit E
MSTTANTSGGLPQGLLARTAGLFAFWVVLSGLNPADLLVGALAAAVAAWTSARLLPPGDWTFRPIALLRLALRFLRQSVVVGVDVAWRALDPRLPLRPGFVIYPTRLSAGMARNVFTSLTSLLPGTVPTGEQDGKLVYHCLDVDQPVVTELAAEEAALSRALGND